MDSEGSVSRRKTVMGHGRVHAGGVQVRSDPAAPFVDVVDGEPEVLHDLALEPGDELVGVGALATGVDQELRIVVDNFGPDAVPSDPALPVETGDAPR